MAGRRSLALIALLGCVLAGCSDAASDDPTTTPTESPTSSERDVIASVPTLPPAARKDTLKGAEAFIRHYIELLNYASDTGDTKPLRSMSSAGCNGCYDYVDLYERIYSHGGYLRGGDWVPQKNALKQRFEGTVRVVISVDAKPGQYRKRRSAPVKTHGTAQYSLTFVAERRTGHWTVIGLDGNQT